MTGHGTSGGAGTILNAFATGKGVAFGLDQDVRARVEPMKAESVWNGRRRLPPAEAALAIETARGTARALGSDERFRVHVQSSIPPKKGLKSSSAIGVAVARAVVDHVGGRLPPERLLSIVAAASLRSRTSLTGALDDAAACLLGGVVFCDNDHRRLLRRENLPSDLIALVRAPSRSIATGRLRRSDFRSLGAYAEEAWLLAHAGNYRDAMLVNTLAYAPVLGITPAFTLRALREGAWAAGLSGKGPAEIALVRRDDLTRFQSLRRGTRLVALNPGAAA